MTSRDCYKRRQPKNAPLTDKLIEETRLRSWTVNYGIRVFNEVIRNNNKIDSEILGVIQGLFRFTLVLHGDGPVRPNGSKFVMPFRFFNCENYGECLDKAAKGMWTSFFCPIFCARRMDLDPDYIEINREEAMYFLDNIKDIS